MGREKKKRRRKEAKEKKKKKKRKTKADPTTRTLPSILALYSLHGASFATVRRWPL